MITSSAIAESRAGSTYLVHRGSVMGPLADGREGPADRKATPSPLTSSGTRQPARRARGALRRGSARQLAGGDRPTRLQRIQVGNGTGQGAYLDQAEPGGHGPRGVRAVRHRG